MASLPSCPSWLSPQQATVPPESSAHALLKPTDTAVASLNPNTPSGGALLTLPPWPSWPRWLSPQHATTDNSRQALSPTGRCHPRWPPSRSATLMSGLQSLRCSHE